MKFATFCPCRGGLIVTALLCATVAAAQEIPMILEVDVESYVGYAGDATDPSRLARSPGPVAPTQPANFGTLVILGDVTRVNSAAAKGVMVIRSQTLRLSPTPAPGSAIADVTRTAVAELSWEFLNEDGSQIGTIYGLSLSGGPPSPGSPEEAQGGSAAIVGGTGAFVGARGTINPTEVVNPRITSQVEDPSMRRTNGGGRARFVFQIFPMVRPEIVSAAGVPEIFHSDNSRVSADRPARPGEDLILRASGLGITGSRVGRRSSIVAPMPVEVMVDDQPSTVIDVEAQGTTGIHQVRFRVPDDTQAGLMKLRIGATWVKSRAIEVPVVNELR
jgi:uncharacterized protein (TIGR03437 family)